MQTAETSAQAFLDEYIKKVVKDETWSLDEFRKNCCFGKDREWVKLFIFSRFKDEIVLGKPGGWLKPSKGKGSPYGIYAVEACKWMQENRHLIDWDAKLPRR